MRFSEIPLSEASSFFVAILLTVIGAGLDTGFFSDGWNNARGAWTVLPNPYV